MIEQLAQMLDVWKRFKCTYEHLLHHDVPLYGMAKANLEDFDVDEAYQQRLGSKFEKLKNQLIKWVNENGVFLKSVGLNYIM